MPQLDITEHAGKQRRLMRGKRGVVFAPQLQLFMAALACYNNYRNNNNTNNGHATIEMKR